MKLSKPKLSKVFILGVVVLVVLGLSPGIPAVAQPYSTSAGDTVSNAEQPSSGDMPTEPGETAVKFEADWGETLYATAATPVEVTVDTVAYPRVDALRQNLNATPGDTASVDFELSNLGNASDTYSLGVTIQDDTGNVDSWDTKVISQQNISGDTAVSTTVGSIRPLLIGGPDTRSVEVRVSVPDTADLKAVPRDVVLTATSSLSASATSGPHGRTDDSDSTTLTESQFDAIEFLDLAGDTTSTYQGREAAGTIRAQPDVTTESTLDVILKGSGSDLMVTLEETMAGTYEANFGVTEGASRFDDHPEFGGQVPLIAVEPESTEVSVVVADTTAISDTATWVAGAGPGKSVKDVRTWPNPFNPTDPDPLVFQDLPSDPSMEIFIYNGAGQVVRRLSVGRGIEQLSDHNVAKWFGQNDRGRTVASGMYTYVVRSQYGVTKGAVTVVK